MDKVIEKPKNLGFLLLQTFYILVGGILLLSPVTLVWGTATTGASLVQQILAFVLLLFGIVTLLIAYFLAKFTYKSLRNALYLIILFILLQLGFILWAVRDLIRGVYVDSPRQAIIQPAILIIIALITIWVIRQNLRKFTV